MLYSSIVPFYKKLYGINLTFDKLQSLDEKNDYAFKVPYKRIVYRSKTNTIEIPSFYIYTDINYEVQPAINGYFLFADGTTIGFDQVPLFPQNIVNFEHNGKLVLVSPLINLSTPFEWYYGPFVIVINPAAQGVTYYSDRLYVTDDIHNYLKLEWWNNTNLQIGPRLIPYEYGYRPHCYVDALLGKPEYSFEEEIVERLGYKFVQSAISKKVYKFGFVAPEYLCDSVRIMRICNNKKITRYDKPNYAETLEPMTLSMDMSWDEQGHYALVSVSFETDLVAANPSGYIPLQTGDFNNDYNNDFDNF